MLRNETQAAVTWLRFSGAGSLVCLLKILLLAKILFLFTVYSYARVAGLGGRAVGDRMPVHNWGVTEMSSAFYVFKLTSFWL